MSVGQIQNVMIADDQPDSRQMIKEHVEDANYKAVVQDEKIGNLDNFIEIIKKKKPDALIIDNHLNQKNYATFTGIHAIIKVRKIFLMLPILLASNYINDDILDIRPYRQYVPVIISSDMNPDIITQGFKLSQNELNGIYIPERRPWRSLIRVEEMSEDNSYAYIIIPSWSTRERIKLPTFLFPYQDEKLLGMRFFADVNIGAEKYSDIYCHAIEIAKRPEGKYAKFLHS